MNLFELAAKITLDTKEYMDGIGKALEPAKKLTSALGSGLAAATKAVGAGLAAAGAGIAALGTQSVKGYADYEQLVGGVSKLFGTAGQSLEEYAASTGQTVSEASAAFQQLQQAESMMAQQAADAYKTAGLTANEYMETVTSFSASLISSLDGDTVAAAEKADVALRAMSDNANTFGTDMASLQATYQGFAKQNYTMLDNLKLGYGGTKTEMERLILDAEGLNSSFQAQRDSNGELAMSFADIVDAIQIVQEAQGIAGTTAREASTTISGSWGMLSASWQNLVTGFVDGSADISALVANVAESAKAFLGNLGPVIQQTLAGMGTAVQEIGPIIQQVLPMILGMLPDILSAGASMLESLIQGISDNQDSLVDTAVTLIMTFAEFLINNLPMIIEVGLDVIMAVVEGIIEHLDELIPAAVDAIMTIVGALIEHIPELLKAAWEIIKAIGRYLISDLGPILDSAWEWVKEIAAKIVEKASELLASAKELVSKLAQGLIDNINMIIDKGREIVDQLKETIVGKVSDLLDAGYQLVQGIWNGISDAAGWLWDQISGFASNLVGKFKSFLGIRSPSKVMRDEVGKNIGLGVAEGIDDTIPDATQAAKDLAEATTGVLKYEAETDYTALMLMAKDYEEFIQLAAKREAKIEGERISMKKTGYKSTMELYEQWRSEYKKMTYEADKDYTALMLLAKDYAEFQELAAKREAKIIGENIDIQQKGWKTSEEIFEEWKAGYENLAYEADKDYTALMLKADTYEKFLALARERNAKIIGENIDLAAQGWKSTQEIYEQWKNAGNELLYDVEADYAALILRSKTLEEAMEYAKQRDAKIIGENIDIVAKGWKTTEEILSEWQAATESVSEGTEAEVSDIAEKTSKKAGELVDKVQEQMEAVTALMRKVESNFRAIGKNMMIELAEGIKDGTGKALEAVRMAVQKAIRTAAAEAGIVYATGTGVTAPASTVSPGTTVRVNDGGAAAGHQQIVIQFTGDLAQLGRVLQPVIKTETTRVGGDLVTA